MGFTQREVGDLGPCFIADTAVITKDGVKNIQDVKKDDFVLTHMGAFKPVSSSMKRTYTGDLYKIQPHYTGLVITTTPEHPFYAREYVIRDRFKVNGIEKRNVVQPKEPSFIPAKEIGKKTHFIDFYWMMGYFVGDGWITNEKNGSRIFFIVADKELDIVVPRLMRVLNIKIRQKSGKKFARIAPLCKIYRVFNKEAATILSDFGKYAYGKKIPQWLLKAPKNLIRHFIDGYIQADGCVDDDVERIVTVSRDLAINLQRLYAKLGCIAAVSLTRRDPKKKVLINEIWCHQRDVYEVENYIRPKRRHTYSFLENGYVWYSIRTIEKIEAANIEVYNLAVAEDESYTANSVAVHNCYGHQWRHFGADYVDCHTDYTNKGTDQLIDVIKTLKTNPNDRRIIMSAWNPPQISQMALPPCHVLCQFYVFDGELSCMLYQRSGDVGLGIPFNIASYCLLTCMIAQVCGLTPGDFIHCLGDTHVYINHIEPLKEQILRIPRPFPKLEINPNKTCIDDFVFEDFKLIGYNPHESIKMEMAI